MEDMEDMASKAMRFAIRQLQREGGDRKPWTVLPFDN